MQALRFYIIGFFEITRCVECFREIKENRAAANVSSVSNPAAPKGANSSIDECRSGVQPNFRCHYDNVHGTCAITFGIGATLTGLAITLTEDTDTAGRE